MLYISLMVTTDQKPLTDTHTKKKKKKKRNFKHDTKDNYHVKGMSAKEKGQKYP